MKELVRKGTAGVVASVLALDLFTAGSSSAVAAPEQAEGPAGNALARLPLAALGSFVLDSAKMARMHMAGAEAVMGSTAALQATFAYGIEMTRQTGIDTTAQSAATAPGR